MAFAAIGLGMLGVPRTATADILVTVSSGTSSQTFDSGAGNNTSFSTPSFTINGYDGQVNIVTTNYPGTSIVGSLATGVSFSSEPGTSGNPSLTVQVQLTNGPPLQQNLVWNLPSTNPVTVNSASAFNAQAGVTGGTDTVTTYFNSTSSTTTTGLTGTGPISATAVGSASGLVSQSIPNPAPGSYTLSQTVVLTNLTTLGTSIPVVYSGTSSVVAIPEPSTMAIAGIGALGMIGYGIRRRKARGA